MNDAAPTYDFALDVQRTGLFDTPVVIARLKDPQPLVRDLADAIQARKAADEGVERSNVGGWHSDTKMLDWGGAAARALVEHAIGLVERMSHFKDTRAPSGWRAEMWANVSRAGDLNLMHAHPGNLWAGVFYVDDGVRDGDAADGGELTAGP